ncbi:putative E3 ubiquitin-protein ligase, partial [Ophiophagus hannah]
MQVQVGQADIPCPITECNEHLDETTILFNLPHDDIIKYKYFLELGRIGSGTKPCPQCKHFTTFKRKGHIPNPTRMENKYKIQCPTCQFVWCFKCHSPWHEGVNCKEFKKGDKLLRHWASEIEHGQRNAQKCPKCKTLQCKADSLDLELKRKKDGLNMLMMERNQLNNQINMANGNHFFSIIKIMNEIPFLHHQIRERELLAEQDRLFRSKIADDYAVLTKENNLLQSRFLELVKQTNIERVLKEEMYTTHSMSIAQFLTVKDQEEQLQHEIKTHQDLLEQEMSTFQELEDKISLLEKRSTTVDLNIATLSSRIAEVTAMLEKEEQDNIELKRENSLLIDFASNLKKQLAGKENSLLEASNKMLGLDEAISALKMKHTLHQSLQSEKWDKVSKMANTMMKLSNSMVNIIDRIGKE